MEGQIAGIQQAKGPVFGGMMADKRRHTTNLRRCSREYEVGGGSEEDGGGRIFSLFP
jgi:hypothetical protein